MKDDEKRKELEAAGYWIRVWEEDWHIESKVRTPDGWKYDDGCYAGETEKQVEDRKVKLLTLLVNKAWQHYQVSQRTELLERIIYECTNLSDFLSGNFSEDLYNEITAKFEDSE